MRKGIEFEELRPGSGLTADPGQTVTIRYTDFLNHGDKFQENITCTFRVGSREVIPGLWRRRDAGGRTAAGAS